MKTDNGRDANERGWPELRDWAFDNLLIAWTTYPEIFHHSPDVARLMIVVAAYRQRLVASSLHPSLPHRPGMDSANAIGTVFAANAMEGEEAKVGEDADPVSAGARWLTRLRDRVADRLQAALTKDADSMETDEWLAVLLTFLPRRPGRPAGAKLN